MALIGAGLALLVSLVVGGFSIVMGRRFGIVDHPDEELKSHIRPAVPLGGFAVFLGIQVGLTTSGEFDTGLLLASGVVWVLGLIDDMRGLSPFLRLVGATVAGTILVVVSNPSEEWTTNLLLVAVVVVTINAINLLDGMDALAAVTSAVVLLGLAVYGGLHGASDAMVGIVAVGALSGFLFWNRPIARLFLGDNGAYVVGLTLGWTAMRLSATGYQFDAVAIALIGVPVLDLGVTVVRRLIMRVPLLSGDRAHTYDVLRDAGLSVWTIVGVYAGAQACWAAVLIPISSVVSNAAAGLIAITLAAVTVALVGVLLARRPALRG